MIIDFGDSYQLECSIENLEPKVTLVGKYNTINYSSSCNEEKSYLNKGFLAFKLLDFSSNIVIKNHNRIVSSNGREVLIDFMDNNDKKIFIYFNLISGEIGFDVN